jgi:hypothetical protein
MDVQSIFTNAVKTVKANSPAIFTALGIGGVIVTSYLVARGSFKAAEVLIKEEEELPKKELAAKVWKFYVPAVISGTATVGCILCASRATNKRALAAVAAYSITDKAFSEYREKVAEQFGKGKEQKVRDEIAEEYVTKNPPKPQEVIITGSGHILCCELYTGRYFRSDIEKLRRSENIINSRVNNELYVPLDELYDLIGLRSTSQSPNVGWASPRLLEIRYSTVLSEDGEPCIAFDYNYVSPLCS